jgi:uncharacterized membrane protein
MGFYSSLLPFISLGIAIYAINKVQKLEKELKKLQITKNSLNTEHPTNNLQIPIKTEIDQTKKVPTPNPSKTSSPISNFIKWFANDWPLKTGAFFILLSFVWIITYAFLNNWIGPIGRVTLGIFSGSLIILGGNYRLKNYKNQGVVIIVLGSAISIFSVYAAQYMYQILNPYVALLFIGAISVLVSTISLKYQSKALILIAVVTSAVAPITIDSSQSSVLELFSYLFVISSGVLWVVHKENWGFLTPIMLSVVSAYSAFYLSNSFIFSPLEILHFKLVGVTMVSLFYAACLASLISNKKIKIPEVITAVGTAIYSIMFILTLANDSNQSLLIAAVGILFASGAYLTYLQTNDKRLVYLYTGVAVIMLTIATAVEFEGPVLTFAIAIQAVIIPIILTKLINDKIAYYSLFYFIILLAISLKAVENFPPLSLSATETLTNRAMSVISINDFLTLLISFSAFTVMGYYLVFSYRYKTEISKLRMFRAGTAFYTIALMHSFTLMWIFLNRVLLTSSLARGICLVTYLVVGISLYIYGQTKHSKMLNILGTSIVMLVLARLLLIEVWEMQLSFRIFTFLAVGLVLAGSVLIKKPNTKHE